jgi:hypothetical protein
MDLGMLAGLGYFVDVSDQRKEKTAAGYKRTRVSLHRDEQDQMAECEEIILMMRRLHPLNQWIGCGKVLMFLDITKLPSRPRPALLI